MTNQEQEPDDMYKIIDDSDEPKPFAQSAIDIANRAYVRKLHMLVEMHCNTIIAYGHMILSMNPQMKNTSEIFARITAVEDEMYKILDDIDVDLRD